jgi:predicted small secreted protein
MKRTLVILVMAILVSTIVTSCASSKGGCYGTQGYVGYGSRR